MIENLLPLKIPPGLFSNGTKYQSLGRWNDGNLVRFHEGTIQPIGGWTPVALSGAAILGSATATISWLLADGTPFLAVGTTAGLYVIDDNEVVYDITPAAGIMHAAPFDWQLSLFGSYLIAVNTLLGDDDISKVNTYLWTGNTATPATAAWTDAVGPRGAYSAFATPERFLVVLRGEDPTAAPARTGVDTPYSERRVYWPSQEQLDEFISTDTNTGGNFDLATDGRLIAGASARGQSLLWTDVDLWTMNYIGGELIYAFANAGRECGIVSRRAHVVLDKGAYWMGRDKFFIYDGYVRSIPCEVSDAVFGDFNRAMAHTVWAIANPRFNEVTWFYPDLGATTPTRYVTFNYLEEHWTYGQLQRACGLPQRFRHDVINPPVPLMFDGVEMYNHETGNERGGQAFVTTGPVELGNGDRLMRVQGIVPDDKTLGDVQLRLYTSMAPDGLEMVLGPFTLATKTDLRQTARQVRVRLEETPGAGSWRVGTVRLAVRPSERRGALSQTLDLVPASLEIVPASVSLIAGQHYTFQAIVRNAAGEALDVQPDSWTSSDTSALTINDRGTVTVLKAPATIGVQAHLSSLGLSSNIATLAVAARVPASITISPSVLNANTGVQYLLTATVRDVFGVVLTDQSVTWHTSDATKATVDASGMLTTVGTSGSCNVTATLATPALTSNTCVVTCLNQWVIHTFALGDNFSVTTGGSGVEYLMVGGGGSGGSVDGTGVGGGGGGAGELLHRVSQTFAVGVYPVGIGGGGPVNIADHNVGAGAVPGANGTDTTFNGDLARGGGGGGGTDATIYRRGKNGGSGGGGSSCINGGPWDGGAPTAVPPGLGFAGATGAQDSSSVGAGGGGANGTPTTIGVGGPGLPFDIEDVPGGALLTYAQGGGANNGPGSAGADRGYGGTGGGLAQGCQGGAGGKGRLVIRYPVSSGIVATGGTRVLKP